METYKNKKLRISVVIIITLISIIEFYFSYKVYKEYKGVYSFRIFPVAIIQPYIFNSLLKNQKKHFKLKFTAVLIITISLPMIMYFTLPNYKYEDGKKILKEHLNSKEKLVFEQYFNGKDTIPISNNPKRLFVDNRAYYYRVKESANIRYYMVNPVTGRVGQLKEDYWREN